VHRRALLVVGLLVPWASAQATNDESLPPATDLRELAAQSGRLKAPIVVLFSTPGCPYCREVRRNYLAPRLAGRAGGAVLIRQIDIISRDPLTAFDGRVTTHAEFATRLGVRMVPVVMAFGVHGQPIGDPLVGLDRSGFYDGYLQSLVAQAQRQFDR
jgi:thioredoxin-like negative regulator of GroEL